MYYNQTEFKSTTYSAPPDGLTDNEKKASKWYLKWARAIFCDYVQNKSVIGLGQRDEFSMLRAYGNSMQPESDAMGLVFSQYNDTSKTLEEKRKGLHNIDPSILPIMVKFKYAILGRFQDIDYTLFANATDKFSTDEKENHKWQMYADKQLKDIIDEVDIATGTPQPENESWVPNDVNDLNLYESLGGFRLACEIGIEKINEVILETDSRIDELKEKWIEDAIDLGYMAGITKTDPFTQKVYSEYVDPNFAIAKYNRENSFDGQKYGAYIKSVSIADLRKSGEFTETQLRDYADKFIEQQSGSYKTMDSYTIYDETTQTWGYDAFKVDELVGWVVSDSRQYRRKTVSKKGRVIKDEEVDKREKGDGVYHVDSAVLYTFSWIIGTADVYGCGPERDVVYDMKNYPRIPLQIVKLPGQSITKRCVPNLKNMQVGWIKFQNGLTKSRPPGLAINYDSVSNMNIKGVKTKGTEILKIAMNDGNIIYRATTKHGNINMPGGKPVYELAGGFGTLLDDFLKVFEMNRGFIQEFTGVTAESSGGDVPERQSAMLSELMYNNTSNNLKPIIKGYHRLKLRLAEDCTIRAQNGIRFSKKAREYYTACVGALYVDSLQIPGGKSFRDIGISLKLKPDQAMKERVLQAAIESMKVGKNGQPGITHADYVLIEMMVEHGNLKEAQKRLDIIIKEAEARAAKQAEAITKQNNDHQAAMMEMTSKEKEAERQHEINLKELELKKEDELKTKLKRMELEYLDKKILLAQLQKQTVEN